MTVQAPELEQPAHANEVRLVGRLSVTPEERRLPSGDVVMTVRLVVDRDSGGRRRTGGGQSATFDTLSCAVWRGDLRRAVRSWRAGDVVEVTGSLRRRFWQSPGGPANRYEVEVAGARRVAKSGG